MAQIRPFVASRYQEKDADRLSKLLTPPYDVISPQMQEDFYAADEHNLVRIDFGKELPGDDEEENKYSRAATTWSQWKRKHVIEDDHKKAFYAYEQEFALPDGRTVKRRGFFAAVKVVDFTEGGVKAHEHTFDGPKADRFRLTQATNCNMSPIFVLFEDPQLLVDKVLEKYMSKTPIQQATMGGVVNRLWVIDGDKDIEAIQAALSDKDLFIADGHHRYETALRYRNTMRECGEKHNGEEPFDYTLMYLNNIHDPGLEVLPTHRVLCREICDDINEEEVFEDLGEYFDITEIKIDPEKPEDEALRLKKELAQAGEKTNAFVMVLPGDRAFLLALKADADLKEMIDDEDVVDAVRKLDVTILHSYIINRAWLGNPEIELDDEDVHYVKDDAEVLTRMKKKKYGVAFMMNSTPVEQVCEVAGAGERMPHKSTYFYPKLVTGMVIRDMNAPW